MSKPSESGSILTIVLISVLVMAFVALGGFGYWAYSGRQDYKNNTDTKIAAAVKVAEDAQAARLEKEFEEQFKNPHKTYQSPTSSGNVTFDYPRTWSAYVDETNTSQPINGYYYPHQVPGIQSKTSFALRVEMINTDYSQVVKSFDSKVKDGSLKATPYMPPKMAGVSNVQIGIKLDGAIAQDKTGSMVILKVRDKTLKISSEAADFIGDFNNIVLPSLTYLP